MEKTFEELKAEYEAIELQIAELRERRNAVNKKAIDMTEKFSIGDKVKNKYGRTAVVVERRDCRYGGFNSPEYIGKTIKKNGQVGERELRLYSFEQWEKV